MKSQTVPSFWGKYERLDEFLKKQARKAFALWVENPFHPSLTALQKGFFTAKHAKAAKKKQNRESFFKIICAKVQHSKSIFEFPSRSLRSSRLKIVFAVDSLTCGKIRGW